MELAIRKPEIATALSVTVELIAPSKAAATISAVRTAANASWDRALVLLGTTAVFAKTPLDAKPRIA